MRAALPRDRCERLRPRVASTAGLPPRCSRYAGCPSPNPARRASRRWRAGEQGELPEARGETCV